MAFGISILIKQVTSFIPKSWKVREEVKAQGEGQLALADSSVDFRQQRMGWGPEASRYLATAFAFGIRENAAAVLEAAEKISREQDFGDRFLRRAIEDPSIIGATLEASKFTSSAELQDLLGRILAGDVDAPGSVSRRAVSVAEDLSPADLREFLKLRLAIWIVKAKREIPFACILVMGRRVRRDGQPFLSFDFVEMGIDFHAFGEFQSLGLLQARPLGVDVGWKDTNDPLYWSYGSRHIALSPTAEDNSITVGDYLLTKAGMEIMSLFVDAEMVPLEGYFEEVCEYWRRQGMEVTELPS